MVAVLALFPFLRPGFYFGELALLFTIYVVLAYAWNLAGGYAGEISLGNAVFFGLGGYITALLSASWTTTLEAIVLGAALSGAASLLLVPLFRLKSTYFAIATLFMNLGIPSLLVEWRFLTGSAVVLYLPLELLSSPETAYYIGVLAVAIIVTTTFLLQRTKAAYAWRAIKTDETSASGLGVPVTLYKTLALVLMACFTAVAGGIYAVYIGFAEPSDIFNVTWSVYPLFMVVVGGTGTLIGPLIGSAIFALTNQVLLTFFGQFSVLGFGVLLVIIILILPGGIVSLRYPRMSPKRGEDRSSAGSQSEQPRGKQLWKDSR